jgi:predicted nucleotidyltransferase
LAASLFGKTRRAVLSLLYCHAGEQFYLRQITRNAGAGQGAVQRELARLVDAGVVLRTVKGMQVYYQANPECPVFAELKGLVLKTVGLADVLRVVLAPLAGRVRTAFLYGSFASGRERSESDIDVMVIGKVTFAEVTRALRPAQDRLGREVNPTVYPPAEFQAKLAGGHHFLKAVLAEPKVFLIGDEGELTRLAEGRLAN